MRSTLIRRFSFVLFIGMALIPAWGLAAEIPLSPGAHIIVFTPSDVVPPTDARLRLTQVADACEKFYFHWMNYWGYPPVVTNLFPREADGLVEVLYLKGDQPVASGKYDEPTYGEYLKKCAINQFHLSEHSVFWIFVYLGSPPKKFGDFAGMGNPVAGGQAMANYDDSPGDINPDTSLTTGFNGKFFLKGCIHELGHAFGLPHVGPDPELGLGNSLMGPTTAIYAKAGYTNAEQIYLSQSSAAMLWKHQIFFGTNYNLRAFSSAKLKAYRATYDAASDCITISGKLVSDVSAHSVVVFDDQGKPQEEYWCRGYTARIASDGVFQIKILNPPKAKGHYRILFCFDNGIVSGDGKHIRFVDRGDIYKSYQYTNHKFDFGH